MIDRRHLLKYAAGAAGAAFLAPVINACTSSSSSSSSSTSTSTREKRSAGRADQRTNIVVIYADDQRYDTVRFMPTLERLMAAEATTFTQARQSTPQCSPSRATFLRGQFATGPDGHGVQTNDQRMTPKQRDASLAPWLETAGYHCGMAGKYFDSIQAEHVPPGWAWWRGLVPPRDASRGSAEQDAHGYGVFDASTTSFPDQHQMSYLTGEILSFIDTAPEPWFLWDCPTSPHYPAQPTPRRAHQKTADRWPVVGENTAGKPSWLAGLPAPNGLEVAAKRDQIADMLREVVDLDDHLAAIWTRLRDAGAADRTTVIYTSDNGTALLDHRLPLFAKNLPYDVSSHVPLVCIGPQFPAGEVVHAPVSAAVDVTATCLALAGTAGGVPQHGHSLALLASDAAVNADRVTWGSCTHQAGKRFDIPTNDWVVVDHGIGLRKLIRYQETTGTDQYEAYDLDTDPHELRNWANTSARRAERDQLEAALNDALT